MGRAMGLFMHAIWQDGTLAPVRTPEELLDVLNKHEGRIEGTNAFLVTSEDPLNELAPVEVLAGRRFAVQEDVHPSQQRILDLPLEERAAKVISVAKRQGLE